MPRRTAGKLSPLKAAKVFSAKKEVTEKDAKKLKPLTRYWKHRLEADNWFILGVGALLGFALGLLV